MTYICSSHKKNNLNMWNPPHVTNNTAEMTQTCSHQQGKTDHKLCDHISSINTNAPQGSNTWFGWVELIAWDIEESFQVENMISAYCDMLDRFGQIKRDYNTNKLAWGSQICTAWCLTTIFIPSQMYPIFLPIYSSCFLWIAQGKNVKLPICTKKKKSGSEASMIEDEIMIL